MHSLRERWCCSSRLEWIELPSSGAIGRDDEDIIAESVLKGKMRLVNARECEGVFIVRMCSQPPRVQKPKYGG